MKNLRCRIKDEGCRIKDEGFRIKDVGLRMKELRSIRCSYLFSKSAKSIFKILIEYPFWRDDFENPFYKHHSKTTNKNCDKISTVI